MEVHFFTNPNSIFQYQSQRYGPLNESEYRTTSLFTIASDTEAFAVSNGYFVLFDNDYVPDPDLVNLIIKTTEIHPSDLTPKAKYYVYRGLKRSDFMVLNNNTYELQTLTYAQTNNLELLEFLYNNYNLPSNPLTLSKIYYTGTDTVHNVLRTGRYFIKNGIKLGHFKYIQSQDYSPGFEVVLDFMPNDLVLDIWYATSYDHKLTVNFDPSDTPGNEHIDKLAKRESIHLFIDPVVFWTLNCGNGIRYMNDIYDTTMPEDFYNNFINPFFTKDLFYLDIRNFCDYSLNYNKDQEVTGNNISYNINHRNQETATYTDAIYYSDYWPIKIFNISPYGSNNHIVLNIRFINDNFIRPLIYVDFGVVPKSCIWQGGFSNSTTLVEIEIVKKPEIGFIESKTVQLIIPCISFNGNQYKLPWFSRLYYFDGEINDDLNRFQKTAFDYLFGQINSTGVGGYLFNVNDTGKIYTDNETRNCYDQRKICIPRGWGVDIPAVAQTGIGLSLNSVLFYAKIISEQRPPVSFYTDEFMKYTNEESYSIVHTGSDIVNTNQKVNCHSYEKFDGTNIKLLFQEDSISGKTLQLLISSAEIYVIQQIIKDKENTNLPNYPLTTDLNSDYHSVRFVFEPFNSDSDDGLYYGKGIAKLKGFDNDGSEFIISNIKSSVQMLIHTADWINLSSLEASAQIAGLKDILEENPFPEFSTGDLVSMLKTLRSGVNEDRFTDNVYEAITILRRHYYGRWDKTKGIDREVARLLNFEPFDYAIPSADVWFSLPFQSYLYATDEVRKVYKYIFSKGDENSRRDNPSPYIIDPSGKRIDFGHLLYGIDGLIRDYYNTHENYKKLGFKTSNDFTGCIGDFPNAAGESRLYDHGYKDRISAFHYPPNNDIERLYEINAPEADILSDVDAFGIFNLYRFFTDSSNSNSDLLPLVKGERKLRMDFLFEYYYDDDFDESNATKYPINANYKYRWLNFCRGFEFYGEQVDEPDPYYIADDDHDTPGYIAYQGFIKKNTSTQKYEWVADQINSNGSEHQSKAKMRMRAEAFAHLWYQKNYNEMAIAGVLFFGSYLNRLGDLLKNKTTNQPIRFERLEELSLNEELSEYLEDISPVNPSNVQTSSTELDYVLNRFLTNVKDEFNIEKSARGY